jgi:hypothetical protein
MIFGEAADPELPAARILFDREGASLIDAVLEAGLASRTPAVSD